MSDVRNALLKAIDDLRPILPISDAILEQQDRTSILRIACAYLRLQKYKLSHMPTQITFNTDPPDFATMSLQALEGFCFLLDHNFHIVYITEAVSTNLGFSQIQMLGQCISNFVHPDDFLFLKSAAIVQCGYYGGNLAPPLLLESSLLFTLRMITKLPKRNAGFSQHGYKTVVCHGFFRDIIWNGTTRRDGLMASCQLIDKCGTDVVLGVDHCVFRCTPELRNIYIDHRAGELLGFHPMTLLDRTLYELIHPEDQETILRAHMRLVQMTEYQSISVMVRMLKQGSGHAICQIQLIKICTPTEQSLPYSIVVMIHVYGTEDCCQTSLLQRETAYVNKDTVDQPVGFYSKLFYRNHKMSGSTKNGRKRRN